METLVLLTQSAAWFGIFLIGVAVIWFVSLYAKKNTN